jgi:hypothetical protein
VGTINIYGPLVGKKEQWDSLSWETLFTSDNTIIGSVSNYTLSPFGFGTLKQYFNNTHNFLDT